MNFVNEAGAYEPGVLAEPRRPKLPPDALATVQQLVLWFPNDMRLYWLLAELYAAKGEFAAAKKIMDECVDSGHYSNRKVLMQHREAVKDADEPPRPEPPPERTPKQPTEPGAVHDEQRCGGTSARWGRSRCSRSCALMKRGKAASG